MPSTIKKTLIYYVTSLCLSLLPTPSIACGSWEPPAMPQIEQLKDGQTIPIEIKRAGKEINRYVVLKEVVFSNFEIMKGELFDTGVKDNSEKTEYGGYNFRKGTLYNEKLPSFAVFVIELPEDYNYKKGLFFSPAVTAKITGLAYSKEKRQQMQDFSTNSSRCDH